MPQELDKWLHCVGGAAVEDEDGAVVESPKTFAQQISSPFNFGEENITQPLPENIIVHETVFRGADLEAV